VIESSPGREATPTLIAKAPRHGRRRAPSGERRDRLAASERLIASVRAAFRALPAQARPGRQVRL